MGAARGRLLVDLRGDIRRRADIEAAIDRHPNSDLNRYANQGGAEAWDLLIGARGPEFYRADPPFQATTQANTTSYVLPQNFRSLISVWLTGIYGMPLVPFSTQEEPTLRLPTGIGGLPTHYQLRRRPDGTNVLEVLPKHQPRLVIQVDYVPAYQDMGDGPIGTIAVVGAFAGGVTPLTLARVQDSLNYAPGDVIDASVDAGPTGAGAKPLSYPVVSVDTAAGIVTVAGDVTSGTAWVVNDFLFHHGDYALPTTFDGINGWEEYLVCFAARCALLKDDERELAGEMLQEMERLKLRIQALAPKRDMHRARRVKDVRGGRFPAWLGRRWG